MEIELEGEALTLLPQKAIWWPKEKTLIVADLHWGKSAHFRKHGIAVPSGTQTGDEIKLAGLITAFGAERLMIAGDLFHSHNNKDVEVFNHFRSSHREMAMELVTGNHDILPLEQYVRLGLVQHEQCLTVGPFCIAHDDMESAHFVLHGHVHPGVRLSGRGGQSLSLSCFARDDRRMILPAFGSFTGRYRLDKAAWKHLYIVTENEVIRWK